MSPERDVLVARAFVEPNSGEYGNLAALVLLSKDSDSSDEAGSFPSAAEMLALAADVGFPETCFVRKAKVDVVTGAEREEIFDVQWFTPSAEIDFCGHATVATFGLLAHLGKIDVGKRYRQRCRAGVLGVEVELPKQSSSRVETSDGAPTAQDHRRFSLVTMDQALPKFEPFPGGATAVCEALGLLSGCLGGHQSEENSDCPAVSGVPEIGSTGGRDLIVAMNPAILDALEVDKVCPGVEASSKENNLVGYHLFGWNGGKDGRVVALPVISSSSSSEWDFGGQRVLFHRESTTTLSTVGRISVSSVRNFGPAVAVPEEPATGSANGALACYLVQRGFIDHDAVWEALIGGTTLGREQVDFRICPPMIRRK